jgi:hypothetical protein
LALSVSYGVDTKNLKILKFILLVLISPFSVFSVFLTCLYVRTKVVRDLERGVSILDTAHEFKPKKIYLKITIEFYFNKKLQKKEPLERQFFGVNRMELENKLMYNEHLKLQYW